MEKCRLVQKTAGIPCVAVLLYDVRHFTDPDRPRGGVNHIGHDLGVLRGVVQSRSWREWWESVVEDLVIEFRRAPKSVSVCMMCNKGRHRSVATSWILSSVLKELGYAVVQTHAMQDLWCHETCNNCDRCSSGDIDAKRALVQGAKEIALRCGLHNFAG